MKHLAICVFCLSLSLFVTGVYGHGEGKCLPSTDDNNGGWVKISHLDGFVHGHLDQYYDKHGNSTGRSTSYFGSVPDNDSSYFITCPTPKPERMTAIPDPEDIPYVAGAVDEFSQSGTNGITVTVVYPDKPVEPSTPVNSCDPPEPEQRPVRRSSSTTTSK